MHFFLKSQGNEFCRVVGTMNYTFCQMGVPHSAVGGEIFFWGGGVKPLAAMPHSQSCTSFIYFIYLFHLMTKGPQPLTCHNKITVYISKCH